MRKSAVWHLPGAAAAAADADAVLADPVLADPVLAVAVALAAPVAASALAWADVLELELAELQAASPMPTASETATPPALVIRCTNIPFPRMRSSVFRSRSTWAITFAQLVRFWTNPKYLRP
jgi:hypothetical protein